MALHFVCIMHNNTKSATWVAGSLTDTKAGHAHETFSSLEMKACPLILRSFGTLSSESIISDSCDTFGFGTEGSFLGSCSCAWTIWASGTEVKGLFLAAAAAAARCAAQKRIASLFIENDILNGYRTARFNSFLWYQCQMYYVVWLRRGGLTQKARHQYHNISFVDMLYLIHFPVSSAVNPLTTRAWPCVLGKHHLVAIRPYGTYGQSHCFDCKGTHPFMPCHSRMIGSHCLCSLLGPSKAKITSTTAANECTWLLESHDLEHWSSLISEPLCWTKCKADVARATKKCQTASSAGSKFTLSRSTCNRVHRAQKAGSIYGSCSVDFLRQCEMCKYQLSRIVRKIWLTGLCSIAVALPSDRNRFFQHIGSLLHAWRQTNHGSAVNIQVCAGRLLLKTTNSARLPSLSYIFSGSPKSKQVPSLSRILAWLS